MSGVRHLEDRGLLTGVLEPPTEARGPRWSFDAAAVDALALTYSPPARRARRRPERDTASTAKQRKVVTTMLLAGETNVWKLMSASGASEATIVKCVSLARLSAADLAAQQASEEAAERIRDERHRATRSDYLRRRDHLASLKTIRDQGE